MICIPFLIDGFGGELSLDSVNTEVNNTDGKGLCVTVFFLPHNTIKAHFPKSSSEYIICDLLWDQGSRVAHF